VVLQDLKDSPLPRALIKQMDNEEPVVLETIDNMAYHYLLPAKEQILILRTPMLSPKNSYSVTQYI
jgi:two-component system OmpR family sensor kinase